jgi:fused signal recognition particle receptor
MLEKLSNTFSTLVEKISTEELSEKKLDSLLEDFKISLLENDVALTVTDRIAEELKKKISGNRVGRLEDKEKLIREALRSTLVKILTTDRKVDILKMASEKRIQRKPFIIIFAGVNGTGKTTSIGKIAKFLMNHDLSVIMACADTYRPGAIEQLEIHAKRLGVKIIKHEYGSDSASVAYDAVAHAEAKGINVVLVDTAGRMETNRNLMEEMRKIVKVTQPDLVIFVGDALTGNDAVTQAQEFNTYIPIDASILTKMDADAKGGAALSITYTTQKPIIHLGCGQDYSDLQPFDPQNFADHLLGKGGKYNGA